MADLSSRRSRKSSAGAFDLPARQALIPMLVPRERLPKCNNLKQRHDVPNGLQVIGPSLDGIVIADIGCGLGLRR